MRKNIQDFNLPPIQLQQNEAEGLNINFDGKKYLRWLYKAAVVLVILNTIAIYCKHFTDHPNAWGIIPQFELDMERNIPTYFSSFILLLSSVLLFAVAELKRKQQDKHVWHWRLLSGIFLYMSMDESAGVHEMLIYPLRENFQLTGIFYFSWVIVGGLLVLGLGLYYLPFLFSLSARMRNGLMLAGVVYVSGALGVELFGGYYSDAYGENNFTYGLITTVEESLELAGVLMLMTVLYKHLVQQLASMRFILRPAVSVVDLPFSNTRLKVVKPIEELN
ncbi:hypothetical protein [Pontibacter chinhatensis]|uniref:Uncharacterized protein n=1 Tax=Pontibacter chinhatensis TaxID=1436961 RepID=A0A1I2ML43_9BACT|nr:hypothetical protein [Pontibacter chinhatensis]SFF91808.1 hypothetical protein SAMN05421739_101372 [Pontibacter chinhatensis]